MELKWESGLDTDALEKLSEEALKQIGDKRYDTELIFDGVDRILKLGIAFSGKKVKIKAK